MSNPIAVREPLRRLRIQLDQRDGRHDCKRAGQAADAARRGLPVCQIACHEGARSARDDYLPIWETQTARSLTSMRQVAGASGGLAVAVEAIEHRH